MRKRKQPSARYRYDIALEEGTGSYLVAWVSGLMVFFVTLALAVSFALSTMTQGWMADLAGSMTVEIKPAQGETGRQALDAKAGNILKLSMQHPSVREARLLPDEEVAALVEPWLGESLPENMPLPALIDITLAPAADVALLKQDILAIVPGATVDTHDDALAGMLTLTRTIRLFVLLLTGVITALAVVSIAGIVRAKFSIHGPEVETLHLIGASDEYIARQFRQHTLRSTLKGALAGLAGMVATLLAIGHVTGTIDTAILPHFTLAPAQWIALIVSPLLAGTLVAHFTAQRAVMKELAKLP